MNKAKKMYLQFIFSIISMSIIFVGNILFEIALITDEILFPNVEDFVCYPNWYQILVILSLVIIGFGLIGCLLTKNNLNTSKLEVKINLILFAVGLFLTFFFVLVRNESIFKIVMIEIGSFMLITGFFCGIGTLIGRIKKITLVYASIYRELINNGQIDYNDFSLNKGVDIFNIRKVEKKLKILFPSDLVLFLIEFNGDNDLLYQLDKIKITNNLCLIGKISNNLYCGYLIKDNFIKDEQIYLLNEETNKITLIANSLKDLINKYYYKNIDLT